MCTHTKSAMDKCDNTDSSELATKADASWLEKCLETENVFVDYLKSIMVASFNVDSPPETILSEYDAGGESGFEALDNLYDLLASLCDSNLNRSETADLGGSGSHISEQDKSKKPESRNKRTLKCLSPSYGKELQVKPNRARSHSSVGVDEIMRTQELIDVNAADSRRKSRRVSLGMRPKFSNWSKVKGAFKRDKSNSRADSRDMDYAEAGNSGDESTEKSGQFSSSHENINQLSSSDEEFEYYPAGYPNEAGLSYRANDEKILRKSPGNAITKSKSAIIQNHPRASTSTHKNPFKWYRSKNATCRSENYPQEAVSTPPSPYKMCRFLYDEDSVNKINDEHSGNSGNEASANMSNEVLQEVQNKYENLQKRLSREFYEKYQDWRRGQGHGEPPANDADDEKCASGSVDESKLPPNLAGQITPRFKQKFQEWQKMKGLSLSPTRSKIKSENFNPLKKSKTDWHKWRPGSKSESNVIRFLQDKEVGEPSPDADSVNSFGNVESGSKRQVVKTNQPVIAKKELAWLEKELQKVAREKQRLEKEKERYAERETRLQNMKRAIKSGRKRKQDEVLVPTSTGLFRFQGISSKFTRKLYEWEKAKGITPESSTFALLDSYYGGGDSQLHNMDPTMLSRSRSVGSVEVAGVNTSMLQSNSGNHQQSSLSLNDMEQLEEAHLNVENDNLTQSGSQQFEKDDDNEFDLISTESFVIPEYSKCSTSHSIPLSSSSVKSFHDQDSNNLCSSNYARKISDEKGDLCGSYGAGPRIKFHPIQIQTDPDYELVLHKKEQRDSANADARSIVDQIKKLRARTSIDDEDRINILTNLEHLADQLVDMVHTLNTHKNEDSEELAVQIAELAVTLKKKIKRLTQDELRTNYASSEKLSTSGPNTNENFPVEDAFNFEQPEDTCTDTEDNDSPTVHCTFTLPSWRVNKYTTPSSTESESYTTKNKCVDTRQTKTERQRGKYIKDDNSSGGDENYDGSDETTLYIDLRSMKNKNKRRDSSDNISTSASESLVHSDTRDFNILKYSPSPEPAGGNDDQHVLYCSLTLDGEKGNEVKERKLNARNADAEIEHLLEHDVDTPVKMELRSYSPKPVSSKRKCSSCGRIKRVSKSRKNITNYYCPCGKKEADKTGTTMEGSPIVQKSSSISNVIADSPNFLKPVAHSPKNDDLVATKAGKIFRSKVYDFNSLKNEEKSGAIESDGSSKPSDKSSINVIVPTTRKIFAPLKQNEDGAASAVVSYTIDECETASKDESVDNNSDNKQASSNSNFISTPWLSDPRSKSASPAVDRKNTAASDTRTPLLQRPRDKKKLPALELHANVDKLPPASPLSTKRVSSRDGPSNNSSIRMMIAHYNKLTSENPEKKSLDSSCWTSAKQKSPVVERRTRFENVTSETNNNLRKSRSAVLAARGQKPETNGELSQDQNSNFGIAKSSSAGTLRRSPPSNVLRVNKPTEIKRSPPVNAKRGDKKPVIRQKSSSGSGEAKSVRRGTSAKSKSGDAKSLKSGAIKNSATIAAFPSPSLERNTSFEDVLSDAKLRNMKLREARHKFFNENPEGAAAAEHQDSKSNDDSQERFDDADDNQSTTTELEHENMNFSGLNKSISTGAIDDRTRNCNLPGTCEKSPSKSKFGFSSIASKFRKVKMRRHKEPEISAVSSLCRASLMMSIDKEGKQREYLNSKSCPSSPVMARSMSKRNSSSN